MSPPKGGITRIKAREGLLSHIQAAKKLHISQVLIIQALRKGVVAYEDYKVRKVRYLVAHKIREKIQETWYIQPDELDRFQQRLIAQKHADLPQPEEFHVGVRRRVYNWSLRTARLRMGLKGSALGRLVEVSGAAIYSYENFRSYPSTDVAEKIAQVLNVEVGTIFPASIKQLRMRQPPSLIEDAHQSLERLSQGLPTALLTSSYNIEEEIEQKELKETLEEVLGTLEERERQVLRLHYGLENGEPLTLEEIGKRLGVTRSRIGQILTKALFTMGSGRRRKKLSAFLE